MLLNILLIDLALPESTRSKHLSRACCAVTTKANLNRKHQPLSPGRESKFVMTLKQNRQEPLDEVKVEVGVSLGVVVEVDVEFEVDVEDGVEVVGGVEVNVEVEVAVEVLLTLTWSVWRVALLQPQLQPELQPQLQPWIWMPQRKLVRSLRTTGQFMLRLSFMLRLRYCLRLRNWLLNPKEPNHLMNCRVWRVLCLYGCSSSRS